MATQLTREALFAETDKTLKAITSPAFMEAMKTFRATELSQRADFAKESMSPDILKSQGAPIPEGMRITSRVFDDTKDINDFDLQGARKILEHIDNNKPELFTQLHAQHPAILSEIVRDFGSSIPGLSPDRFPGLPDAPMREPVFPGVLPGEPMIPGDLRPFEPDRPPGGGTDWNPNAVSGCAGGGGLSFCGCAGGGT